MESKTSKFWFRNNLPNKRDENKFCKKRIWFCFSEIHWCLPLLKRGEILAQGKLNES